MANKINVVLVHGAWADGSSWAEVISILNNAGFNTVATQHPLTALADDAEVTRRIVEGQEDAVILVGHSYGGAVITEAAGKCPNVAGLVYIAAFAPDAGESLTDLSQRTKPAPGFTAIHPDKYGTLWLDKEKFAANFCQDVDPKKATVMASVQKPITIKCFSDKVTNAGWKNLPCWYQLSTNDRMIDPGLQYIMAERINARNILTLSTGHAPMLSFPEKIAAFIMDACNQVR